MAQQQLYEWLPRFIFDILLILIFLFIFLHPLWKLSKSRFTMIIVFSRVLKMYYLFNYKRIFRQLEVFFSCFHKFQSTFLAIFCAYGHQLLSIWPMPV